MNEHDADRVYPADIAPVAGALDDLGEAERGAARAGLEGRVARASWRMRAAPELQLGASRAGAARSVAWAQRPSMRLAASVAVVAGGVAAWMAMQPGGGPTGRPAASLEQEVDAWLALAGSDDGLRTEIEALRLLNDELARGLEPWWFEDELSGESL